MGVFQLKIEDLPRACYGPVVAVACPWTSIIGEVVLRNARSVVRSERVAVALP